MKTSALLVSEKSAFEKKDSDSSSVGLYKRTRAGRAASPFSLVGPDDPRWNEFVLNHRKGSIFHTSQMLNVFEKTKFYQPFAVAAAKDDRIVALLAAVRIQSLPSPWGALSSRSIFYAEPICLDNEKGAHALAKLLELHDDVMRRSTLFVEVRPIWEAGCERDIMEQAGYRYLDYLNYVVDLDVSSDELFSKLKKSCRQNIRRSERRGVTVNEMTSFDGVEMLYPLLQSSYGRSQVPLADKSLFHAAYEELPREWVKIMIAFHDDKPLAAGICLVFKDLVFAWYGGGERPQGIAPFDCLTWREIEWGANNGKKWYDFGGAGWPDEEYGPRNFKAKFGGHLVHYGRYRKVYHPKKLALAEKAYQLARRFISPRTANISK